MNNTPWIDTRLNEEEMKFLNIAISEENKENHSKLLVGHITKSETLNDKNNWFYKNVLKKHTERMFYDDWDNYRRYHIKKNESPPKFVMDRFWVNYLKQYEFNPLHNHSGLFSFVIFMKIPTHWEEQHTLNFDNFRAQVASDFMFVWSEHTENFLRTHYFSLSPEDEGRMLFFPAWLQHQVYPFYECEEQRVTISGNIDLCTNIPHNYLKLEKEEIPVGEYELENLLDEKDQTLHLTEERAQQLRKEIEGLREAMDKLQKLN